MQITKIQRMLLQRLVVCGKKAKDARKWIDNVKQKHLIKRDAFIKEHKRIPSTFSEMYDEGDLKKFHDALCLSFVVKDNYELIEDLTEMTMDEELDEAFKKIHVGSEVLDNVIRSSSMLTEGNEEAIELNKDIERDRENLHILIDAYFKAEDKVKFKNLVINLSK